MRLDIHTLMIMIVVDCHSNSSSSRSSSGSSISREAVVVIVMVIITVVTKELPHCATDTFTVANKKYRKVVSRVKRETKNKNWTFRLIIVCQPNTLTKVQR